MDVHYLRFLWRTAESHPGETVYVLNDGDDPYRVYGLEASVYRHPRVQSVSHRPGDPVPPEVPPGTPPERILLLTRAGAPPEVAGAEVTGIAYRSEPGYRVMARLTGIEDAGWIRWLDSVDGWSGSSQPRSLYRIGITP